MLLQQIKWLLQQLCRVAIVILMEHSTILGTTVTGGRRRSTIQQTPGTGT